ncbi:amidohydrolase 3 [Clathrospora elynae]|uniref:Amidohydrolase 3 n=1 Tax=Clathrospora elynae TaxID=706981 RepID=A0A6A5S7N7_9PLEO|nr:amidohydrolase 3 [Clathrospora elynae]
MPFTNNLLWVSLPIAVAAILYQLGLPALIFSSLTEHVAYKVLQSLFPTTHCYASIRTLSSRFSHAECFTVSAGKFSSVFADESSHNAVKQARTGYVYPGLWDGHGHLIQFGESLDSVSLFGVESMDEAQKRLIEYKTGHSEVGTSEEWLRGVGWDQANFRGMWPTSSDLQVDESFKDLYVMLDRVDIPAKGVFCDNAMDLVLEYYPKPNKARKTKFVKDAMVELNKLGIVGIHDAGVVPGDLKLYQELSNDEEWTVRVNAMIECDVRNTFCLEAVEKVSTSNGKLHVKSVKLFGDGALGSWGSAMIEPYSDKESSSGSLLINATTLSQVTHDWAMAGYQVNIHAIGDLANRLAIDAFEAALNTLCPQIAPSECQTNHRFRIEHSQIIHPDDQRRMLELGIIPSIQPTHATSDMGYAESRLGQQRTRDEAYRMRSLHPLRPVLGSDFPVEPANIFEGMYAAITRRSPHTGLDPSGGKNGWYPEETLTLEQALEGFTINPAYGAFLEGKAGVIETGAYADWVVLDEPLESMDLESLRKMTVRETWVAGMRVYQRPGDEDLTL